MSNWDDIPLNDKDYKKIKRYNKTPKKTSFKTEKLNELSNIFEMIESTKDQFIKEDFDEEPKRFFLLQDAELKPFFNDRGMVESVQIPNQSQSQTNSHTLTKFNSDPNTQINKNVHQFSNVNQKPQTSNQNNQQEYAQNLQKQQTTNNNNQIFSFNEKQKEEKVQQLQKQNQSQLQKQQLIEKQQTQLQGQTQKQKVEEDDEVQESQFELQFLVNKMNENVVSGLTFLFSNRIIKKDLNEIAKFLFLNCGINPESLGEFFAQGELFAEEVFPIFMNMFSFKEELLTKSFRKFCERVKVVLKPKQIVNCLRTFGNVYFKQNTNILPNSDLVTEVIYHLCIIGSFDNLHKYSYDEDFINYFKKKLEINGFNEKYFQQLYDDVIVNPIPIFYSEIKGNLTKQGGKIKTWKKRWFQLSAECLSYYKNPDSTIPLGMIPLKQVTIKKIVDQQKKRIGRKSKNIEYKIQITLEGSTVKYAKNKRKRKKKKSNHKQFLIKANTKEECDNWSNSIEQMIMINNCFEH
ncbi:cytohesin-4 [Anaeramoeba flamelloides]|uniref:Cytohesin-4 n=1 Tax=Anaeramoeba flamelloides TaxID=1746091 RepID=A0AAV7YUH4_9EUKA|nr:cytohesin-4 [Anaeramoeba flamelloides]